MSATEPLYRMVQIRADDLSVLLNIVSRARSKGLVGADDQPALAAYTRADQALQSAPRPTVADEYRWAATCGLTTEHAPHADCDGRLYNQNGDRKPLPYPAAVTGGSTPNLVEPSATNGASDEARRG